MNDTETTDTAASRPGQREDGHVDIAAVRQRVYDGPTADDDGEYDEYVDAAVQALCNEVEQLREQHTKFRALYDRNVGSLVDQLDEANARLDASAGGVR